MKPPTSFVFDAGALIAFERRDVDVDVMLSAAAKHGGRIRVPAGALGQAWRDGARQARLASLLGRDYVSVEPLDQQQARWAGELLGACGKKDVVDAHVAVCALRTRAVVVTSDPDDIRALAPTLEIVRV